MVSELLWYSYRYLGTCFQYVNISIKYRLVKNLKLRGSLEDIYIYFFSARYANVSRNTKGRLDLYVFLKLYHSTSEETGPVTQFASITS